ncbi:hypothetical protein PR048_024983 [Dryococelus australis]|uniref:Uncharacterized protein n=1 Tax=Dryococelus australis TaxID=614101 RepID=A0ABQ9GQ21_9NEOP|nr:hypothetical protein PR048_024983 [Dryococelus australis]
MRVIEVNMERRNERAGETGDPRENPRNNDIVRHDSHLPKSGDPTGDWARFGLVGGERANRSATQPQELAKSAYHLEPSYENRPLVSCEFNTVGLEQVCGCRGYRGARVKAVNAALQRRNEGAGETGDPRQNPRTSGIVSHNSHLRKSGGDPDWDLNPVRNATPPVTSGARNQGKLFAPLHLARSVGGGAERERGGNKGGFCSVWRKLARREPLAPTAARALRVEWFQGQGSCEKRRRETQEESEGGATPSFPPG